MANTQAYRLGATGWQPAGQIGCVNRRHRNRRRAHRAHHWRLLAGAACVIEPNGAGGWIGSGLPGQPRGCDDEHWGGPADIAGDRVIIGTPDIADLKIQMIPIYQNGRQGTWNRMGSIDVSGRPARIHGRGRAARR